MKKTLTLLTLGMFCASAASATDFQNEPVKGARAGSAASQTVPNNTNAASQLRNNSIIIFEDNMDMPNDTAGLHARGYVTVYNGEGPQGSTDTFYNGIPSVFTSYNGHDSSYIAANYSVVQGTADIDSWLILPAMNIGTGDSLVFFARAPLPGTTEYPDSMRVMYSNTGELDIFVSDWVELGRFKVRNDDTWGRMGFRAPSPGANARFAIRYAVANGGPTGSTSNLVGIDALTVFSGALGLSENVAAIGMSTYPNPASTTLTVKSVVENGTLTITNALGQQVQRQLIVGTTNVVNVANLASGVYCVSIQSEKGMATQKFVKR